MANRHCLLWIVMGLLATGCPSTDPSLDDDDDITADDDDQAGDDDTGDDDDDDTGTPPPQWECVDYVTMDIHPVPVTTTDTQHLDITQQSGESGHAYIDLSGTDPDGLGVSAQLDDITGTGPWTWWYTHAGLKTGRYDWTFTADQGATWLCDATVWVAGGTGDDDDDTDDDDDDDTGNPPPANPFGIGLVGPGDANQWDRAAELAGRGGHIKLIFPGVELGMGSPPADWSTAVSEVYARDLVPVIRLQTGWGQTGIRYLSDDGNHRVYTSLAQAFANVVSGLPKRDDWPIVIEVFNEPNLCYEWTCNAGEGWLNYTTTAAEYASLLRDVTAALDALGDPRIKVINGGYAPGMNTDCECGTAVGSGGVTGASFIQAMEAAVPGVHAALDGFASHAYPSTGEGWGFFHPYSECHTGLHYWETELATLGFVKPVYITETGWTIDHSDCQPSCGSREDIASWSLQAWQNDWYGDPTIAAVMPFILQDAAWDNFAWVDTGNSPYPVFTSVRDWRCSMAFPDPC